MRGQRGEEAGLPATSADVAAHKERRDALGVPTGKELSEDSEVRRSKSGFNTASSFEMPHLRCKDGESEPQGALQHHVISSPDERTKENGMGSEAIARRAPREAPRTYPLC